MAFTPISIPLALHPARDPGAGRPRAYLLPGSDPATWLSVLAEWSGPLGAVRLALIPGPVHDGIPHGALAILPSEAPVDSGQTARPFPPAALPYHLLAGRLFIPAG